MKSRTFVRSPLCLVTSKLSKLVAASDREPLGRNVFGSFWGEVQANTHRALGCVGTSPLFMCWGRWVQSECVCIVSSMLNVRGVPGAA